ncbi:MAG: hypothetical protein B6244_01395 [Candidatus Cloacimonetes bacterium 4572_55]|nr:MAG: hypothetical protein B6244_01395 [Candidatus Cloacimonetes bacterium 4572_55]
MVLLKLYKNLKCFGFIAALIFVPGLLSFFGDETLWIRVAFYSALFFIAFRLLLPKFADYTATLFCVFCMIYFLRYQSAIAPDFGGRLEIGIIAAASISAISYYLRLLAPDGSAAAFLLGAVVFGLGGWGWAIPLILFFILSSLLSKIAEKRRPQFGLIFEKSSRRDKWQVAANGGLAGIVVIINFFYPSVHFYPAYLGILAAVTADTWSTEIGVLFKKRPRLITNFRQVPHGTSGGVTLPGICGGILGALLIGTIGYFSGPAHLHPYLHPLIITAAGMIGNFIDSLIGARFQVQYRCLICGKVTEKMRHCQNSETEFVSGIPWMNNDHVNLFCAMSGGIAAYLFSCII